MFAPFLSRSFSPSPPTRRSLGAAPAPGRQIQLPPGLPAAPGFLQAFFPLLGEPSLELLRRGVIRIPGIRLEPEDSLESLVESGASGEFLSRESSPGGSGGDLSPPPPPPETSSALPPLVRVPGEPAFGPRSFAFGPGDLFPPPGVPRGPTMAAGELPLVAPLRGLLRPLTSALAVPEFFAFGLPAPAWLWLVTLLALALAAAMVLGFRRL